MLAGHKRYADITGLRGRVMAAQALRLNKVVGDDALRRAMECIDEAPRIAWKGPILMHTVRDALDAFEDSPRPIASNRPPTGRGSSVSSGSCPD